MKVWKGYLEAMAKKEGQGGVLFSCSLQGGDGGACKILEWMLDIDGIDRGCMSSFTLEMQFLLHNEIKYKRLCFQLLDVFDPNCSTGSSIKLSLSSSRSSFIGMTRDSSDKHFFRLETWKVLRIFMSSLGSSSLYATGPIRSSILNGPMYRGLGFPRFPNQMIPLRACKRCQICTIFSMVSWIIYGPGKIPTNGKGDIEYYNHNLQAILPNGIVSCLTLFDQGCAEDFYDQ
ncbi:hypothetical protein Tco_1302965 [Tanacetum coccineum]